MGANVPAAAAYCIPSGSAAASIPTQKDKENVPPFLQKPKSNRPLPLRKRPIDETAKTVPSKGKLLIRHNMREEGAVILCRCKNSKCLK